MEFTGESAASREGPFPVVVRGLAGEVCTVDATRGTTVGELKNVIEARTTILRSRQCLLSRVGTCMNDACKLAEYEVSPLDPIVSLVQVSLFNRLFAIGGYARMTDLMDGQDRLASAEMLDLRRRSWETLPSMTQGRARFGAAALGGKIYVIGGYGDAPDRSTDTRRALESGEVLDVDAAEGAAWVPLPPMCWARAGHSVVALGDKIYALGGGDGTERWASMEVFDPCSGHWATLPSMSTSRTRFAAVVLDGKIYIFGGMTEYYHGSSSAEVFDREVGAWVPLPPMATGRLSPAAAALGGKVYVIGGYDGREVLDTVEVFDPTTCEWNFAPSMRNRRTSSAAAAQHDSIFVLGGAIDTMSTDSLEVYDPSSGSWSLLPHPMSTCRASLQAGFV